MKLVVQILPAGQQVCRLVLLSAGINGSAPPISRTSSANTTITSRNLPQTSPRPAPAKLHRRSHSPSSKSRPPSIIEAPTRSPRPEPLSSPESSSEESSSDSEAPAQSRLLRRPRFHASKLGQSEDGDEDDDDEPAFMPFAAGEPSSHDPSATLRGDPQNIGRRQTTHKKSMEAAQQSQTSDSSASSTAPVTRRPEIPREGVQRQRLTGPLSPRRTAELAGRSPGMKGKGREGSDGTPSMGSSFSDLDGM